MRKILFHEVSVIIYIIGIVFSFIMFVIRPNYEIKEQISLIKQSVHVIETNHLTHIQKSLEEQSDINKKQDEKINSINNNITKILTILNK